MPSVSIYIYVSCNNERYCPRYIIRYERFRWPRTTSEIVCNNFEVLTLYSLAVTSYDTKFNLKKNSTCCPQTAFVVCRSQNKWIISLHSSNRIGFYYKRGGMCSLRGTN